MDGEPITLRADGHQFLAMTMAMASNADQPKGDVIILHGRGHHPNWAQAVAGLPQYGWHSLSMPVLDIYGGKEYPAVKRSAPEQLQMLQLPGYPKSRQQVLPGADH